MGAHHQARPDLPRSSKISHLPSPSYSWGQLLGRPRPQTPRNLQRDPDACPSFFVGSISGPVRSHKRGCARLEKPRPGLAPLVGARRRPGAYTYPLAVPFQANTGPLRAALFSGSSNETRTRPQTAAERLNGPGDQHGKTVYGGRFRSGAATQGHPGARRLATLPFQELPPPRRVFQTTTNHLYAMLISFWCCKW